MCFVSKKCFYDSSFLIELLLTFLSVAVTDSPTARSVTLMLIKSTLRVKESAKMRERFRAL